MKRKGIIAFILVVCAFVSMTATFASAKDLGEEFTSWVNVSDTAASELLKSAREKTGESFVFVYYCDTCFYSQTYVPVFAKYAEKTGLTVCGLNKNSYPRWYDWCYYTNSITYPLVIIYNGETKQTSFAHSVHSEETFSKMIADAGIKTVAPQKNKSFPDVPTNSKYYDAVTYLAQVSAISGYDDGTFRPANNLTRAEIAAIMVRAGGYTVYENSKSIYTDVQDSYWGTPYIMAATREGILNGVGNGKFSPTTNVTYNQILKIAVCIAGYENEALACGGWPNGYVETAFARGIVDSESYVKVKAGLGNFAVTRGEAALFLYNALS